MADEKPKPEYMPENPITTLSDYMLMIQKDNEEILAGRMDSATARERTKNHGLILRGAALQIQHRRLTQGEDSATWISIDRKERRGAAGSLRRRKMKRYCLNRFRQDTVERFNAVK